MVTKQAEGGVCLDDIVDALEGVTTMEKQQLLEAFRGKEALPSEDELRETLADLRLEQARAGRVVADGPNPVADPAYGKGGAFGRTRMPRRRTGNRWA